MQSRYGAHKECLIFENKEQKGLKRKLDISKINKNYHMQINSLVVC